MDAYITRPIAEELDRLKQYLDSQPEMLKVSIDSQVPADRYIVPSSLVLAVQHAQHHSACPSGQPLSVSIRFLKYTVEVSYPFPLPETSDAPFTKLVELVELHRSYYNLPTFNSGDNFFTISIPLFI